MPSLDFRKLSITQESVVFALAAVLFVVFSLTLHNFLTPGNLVALVRSVSILGILDLGMGAGHVIGRGIDLAMVATMVVAALLGPLTRDPSTRAASAGPCLIGFAFAVPRRGLVSGGCSSSPTLLSFRLSSQRSQRGPCYLRRRPGVAVLEVDVQNTPNDSWRSSSFLATRRCWDFPLPIVLFALLALVPWALLRWTRFGRYIYASGDNPTGRRATLAFRARPP